MHKPKLLTIAFCFIFAFNLFSQKGKNGSLTVAIPNTKINEFTALTANVSAGATNISVVASSLNANGRFTSTLSSGDLVMIIQMQGALIKLKPYNVWEAYVTDSLYGEIYNYQNCGNYEFAQVKSIISATQIELECGLKYNYSSTGKTQVVRVPRYNSLNITGTLTTDAWSSVTGIGGVLAAEVDGNTTINGLITATGLGFRGGVPTASGGTDFYPLSSATPANKGAEKGEGIGSDRLNNSIDSLGNYCKGAPGNGGGGGNANNCAGGGGGNGGIITNYNGHGNPSAGFAAIWNLEWPGKASVTSSGGGKGGYGTSTTTTTNINSVGPNNASWGTFRRISAGGYGGRPLDYSTGKIFMGGGGGAGHMTAGQSNGSGACSGGAGGGLIFLLNYGTISGSGAITSNGANGGNAFGTVTFGNPQQGIDGAGGAGAGGTIILQCDGAVSGITANANGGDGGNQIKSGTLNSEGQGPGAGGSGGYIAANGSPFTQNVNGGANGTTNATAFDTEFPMNGATSGGTGTSNQLIAPSFSLTASANQTLCTNQSATVTASSTNTSATIFWYNTAAGGISVASGTVYTTPSYTAIGTYTVYAGSCPGIYRLPIIITVNLGVSFAINSPSICSGQNAVLTVTTTATSYTWNTAGSPTTNTISVSPSITTVYAITGGTGSCVSTQTTQVTVNTTPTVSANSTTLCSGNSATLTALGATNYTWMPSGLTTSSLVITPTTNTTYTITGANGTCSNSTTATANIAPSPTLIVNSATICATQIATLTATGATIYTWNPGNITGNTYTISPASNTTVSVVGANGSCTRSATASVTIGSAISISVNNATICAGRTASLIASGATSYTWSGGANTNTLNVSPTINTTYTISGTSGSCSGSNTAVVNVISVPLISVTNKTICAGGTATLTATGATNYTWMPGNQTSASISDNPNSTTTYTIVGSNGICTNSMIATISVTPIPIVSVNVTSICAGQTATLIASGATNYTWSTTQTTSSITVSPAFTTTYSVVGENNNCFNIKTATVSVIASPTLNISASNATGCAPLCIAFTDQTSSSCSSISYNFGDGNTGSSNNPIHCYTGNGNFTVTATCSNAFGCSTTYTLPTAVQVILTPTADFTIQEGNVVTVGSIVHFNNTSLNATTSNWNFCNGASISTDASTSYADTGTCCITLITANATCTDSTKKCLTIVREAIIVIPNVFTPNGDGINETFKVKSSGLKSLTCAIFDRWGLKMYEWTGVDGYWDGNAKSGMAPDGTYFYIINYTDQLDEAKTEKGFLNLFQN